MAGDLGAAGDRVHDRAREVLDFWFGLPMERQFAKDAALDREIADRFAGWRDEALASDAAGWRDEPDTLLAAVILLDQFSRNLHRGGPDAFAADDLAVTLTLHALAMGWDTAMPADRRAFLYMPLMHAEDRPLQALSVEKFGAPGLERNLAFAIAHRDAIERFGRFPGRNAALGRRSTPEEERWLGENDAW